MERMHIADLFRQPFEIVVLGVQRLRLLEHADLGRQSPQAKTGYLDLDGAFIDCLHETTDCLLASFRGQSVVGSPIFQAAFEGASVQRLERACAVEAPG